VAIFIDLLGWLCSVVALRSLPVFAVQAVAGGSIAVTALVSARLTDTPIDRATRIAVGACLAGLVLVAASAGGDQPEVSSRLVDIVLIAAVLVLAVAVLVLRQYPRAWPLALIAGMGFGGTSLAVRAAHIESFSPSALLAQPAIYLVAGFWAVGIIAYSGAVGRGDIGPVTAVFIVTEVVLPGLVGIVLLGDPVRPGWGWPFALGLAVAVGGVVALARRPQRRSRVR
jgi:drug/metabolite transporter (DMT)-like permease